MSINAIIIRIHVLINKFFPKKNIFQKDKIISKNKKKQKIQIFFKQKFFFQMEQYTSNDQTSQEQFMGDSLSPTRILPSHNETNHPHSTNSIQKKSPIHSKKGILRNSQISGESPTTSLRKNVTIEPHNMTSLNDMSSGIDNGRVTQRTKTSRNKVLIKDPKDPTKYKEPGVQTYQTHSHHYNTNGRNDISQGAQPEIDINSSEEPKSEITNTNAYDDYDKSTSCVKYPRDGNREASYTHNDINS